MGILQSPPSVHTSRHLLLNHCTKSNQIWCVICPHEWCYVGLPSVAGLGRAGAFRGSRTNIPCHFLTPKTLHPAKICQHIQNIPCCFCHPRQNIPCCFCHMISYLTFWPLSKAQGAGTQKLVQLHVPFM